jgi:hypothetical protein
MRWIPALVALGLGTASIAPSQSATAGAPAVAKDSSAQPEPPRSSAAFDSSAITEWTEVGRRIAAPTADSPAYVVIYAKGQQDFGRASAAEKTPAPETLDQQMEKSLAQQHYLRADAKRQPAYLIVFSWGSHRALVYNSQDAGFANLLDRAALVGGNRFSNELRAAMEREVSASDATSDGAFGAQMPGMRPVSAADLFVSISPLERFRKRNQKTEDLMNQISNDCYYVIISAFDYASVGQGKSQLLWRTKLTTTSPGTSLADAIPSLIASGAGYLGRSMSEAELFSGRDR